MTDTHVQIEMIGKIASAVIFRLNYPKVKAGRMTRHASLNAKARPLLSFHDCEEANQTVALALISCGALERGKMTLADWKIVFREVRRTLHIDRNAKRGQADTANPIDLMTEAEADFLTATTRKPYHLARRKAIARKIRYMRAQVFASFAVDIKRSRKATFKKQLAVSRFLASLFQSTSQGFAEICDNADSTLRMTLQRFRLYRQVGENAMTAEALQGVKPRKLEFKSFADLFAVAD